MRIGKRLFPYPVANQVVHFVAEGIKAYAESNGILDNTSYETSGVPLNTPV